MSARDLQRRLSPVEQGLLLHYFYETDSVYIDQMVCDVVGPLDVERLNQALLLLIAAHPALRTTYHQGAGEMSAVVRATSPARTVVVDLSGETDGRAAVERAVAAEREKRLDIGRQASRCTLFRLDEWSHVFAWTYHHVVADSWTLRLLIDQLCAAYRTLETPEATPYATYVDWVVRQERRPPVVTAGRVSLQWSAGPSGVRDRVRVALSARTGDLVAEVASRHRVTTNVVLLGVWGILALDQLGGDECLLGCVVSGRHPSVPGIRTVAGVCANTVPVLVDGSQPVHELLTGLMRDVLAAGDRAHVVLSEALAPAGLSHHDLHSVINFTIDERTVRNRDIDRLPFDITNVRYTQEANFDAYLDIETHAGGIDITVDFDRACRSFDADDLSRKCEHIVGHLAGRPGDAVLDVLDALPASLGRFHFDFDFDAPSASRG